MRAEQKMQECQLTPKHNAAYFLCYGFYWVVSSQELIRVELKEEPLRCSALSSSEAPVFIDKSQ